MGHPKSQSQNPTIQTSSDNHDIIYITDVLVSILDDAFKTLPHYKLADFQRDVASIKRRMLAEGKTFATKLLPSFANDILLVLEGGVAHFKGFKTRNELPVFMRTFVERLLGSKCGETEKATDLKYLYQLCMVFKKLRGPYKESMLKNQWNDFKQVDIDLTNLNWNGLEEKQILNLARYFFSCDFKNVNMEHNTAIPRPGPGGTVYNIPRPCRYEPTVVYSQHDAVLPYSEWFYPLPCTWMHRAPSYRAALNSGTRYKPVPHAEYIFVPKTAGKARGICKETNEAQFLQQAASNRLRAAIAAHPILSAMLPLNDQAINASLALQASSTQEWATLDFSEASDRISRKLVSYVSQDTEMHDVLLALSTRYVKPPKEAGRKRIPFKVAKFAPMGSGLCFPVMALMHYYLIKAILVRRGLPPDVIGNKIYVYGDDIIVPSACVNPIYEMLPKFGMKLNTTKSFCKSYFRESCGIHAYYGHDITPVFIKYVPFDITQQRDNSFGSSFQTVVASFAAEYGFFKRGFSFVAKTIRNYVARFHRCDFVPRESGIVGFYRDPGDQAGDFRDFRFARKRRWSQDLQCYEYRVQRCTRKKIQSSILSDTASLMRYWTLASAKFDSESVIDRPFEDLSFKWSWVPESALQLCTRQ